MTLIDILFWGWYKILDKTVYLYGAHKGSTGPGTHSFFITFLFHGLNLTTILSSLFAKYFNATIPLALSLTLASLIFGIGYLVYFKGGRINKVISYKADITRALLFMFLSLAYAVASTYFMFHVGSYVRAKMGH